MKKGVLFLLCLLLTGCTLPKKAATNSDLSLTPYVEQQDRSASQNVTIYTYNEKRDKLTSSVIPSSSVSESGKARAALSALFQSDPAFSFVQNEEKQPDYTLFVSNKIAIVQIQNPCPITERFTRFKLHMSIVNTLSNQESIDYVMVYAGKEQLGGSAYIGPSRFYDGYLQELYTELYNRTQTEPDSAVTVPLFFVDKGRNYILPEARQLSVNPKKTEECVRALIFQMMNGPMNTSDFRSALTADLTMNSVSIRGKQMIIDLSRAPAASSLDNTRLAYGALFMTLKLIYPELDTITFTINGADSGQPTLAKDYAPVIGYNVMLYFAKQESGFLTPVTRAIPIGEQNNPEAIIRQLISGPSAQEGDTNKAVFPESVAKDDLLSCRVSGDTALINFKTSFYTHVKEMTPTQESLMVYAIVNSLTNMEQVSKVQFLMDGQTFSSLNGHIHYSKPLIPNPGLILKQS